MSNTKDFNALSGEPLIEQDQLKRFFYMSVCMCVSLSRSQYFIRHQTLSRKESLA